MLIALGFVFAAPLVGVWIFVGLLVLLLVGLHYLGMLLPLPTMAL